MKIAEWKIEKSGRIFVSTVRITTLKNRVAADSAKKKKILSNISLRLPHCVQQQKNWLIEYVTLYSLP